SDSSTGAPRTSRCWLQARKPDGGTRLGAPPPGPRASGSSTTPSTSTGTPQTTGKRSSRPTITPSDFHINHEGSRNGYTTPRDLTTLRRSWGEPSRAVCDLQSPAEDDQRGSTYGEAHRGCVAHARRVTAEAVRSTPEEDRLPRLNSAWATFIHLVSGIPGGAQAPASTGSLRDLAFSETTTFAMLDAIARTMLPSRLPTCGSFL